MRKLLRSFFDRYFHDEEAIIFVILLAIALLVLVTMGSILARSSLRSSLPISCKG